jgi:hypothetical protein
MRLCPLPSTQKDPFQFLRSFLKRRRTVTSFISTRPTRALSQPTLCAISPKDSTPATLSWFSRTPGHRRSFKRRLKACYPRSSRTRWTAVFCFSTRRPLGPASWSAASRTGSFSKPRLAVRFSGCAQTLALVSIIKPKSASGRWWKTAPTRFLVDRGGRILYATSSTVRVWGNGQIRSCGMGTRGAPGRRGLRRGKSGTRRWASVIIAVPPSRVK